MHPREKAYAYVAIALLAAYPVLHAVRWTSDSRTHGLLELAAALLALFVGVVALVRFYSHKHTTILLIGAGFVGTAFLDGYHAIVTSPGVVVHLPSSLPSLIPWSWVASRTFLSLMLVLSAFPGRVRLGETPERPVGERTVFTLAGTLCLACFAFFVFFPLPAAYYPDLPLHRPEELVPGALFLAALIGFWRKGAWREDPFEHWLMIALVINVISQVVYMPLSAGLFDMPFDVAHWLKSVGYVAVLVGLLHNVFASFRQAHANAVLLELQVLERTDDLQRSNKELDEFAYVASHDLQAPLRDVDNLAGWIAEDLGETLPADSARHLSTLRQRIARMERLLDDLLQYSRVGRRDPPAETIDVATLLEDVARVVSPPAGFTVEVSGSVPPFSGVRSALEQVLTNLAGNAIKHHDQPKGTVWIEASSTERFAEFRVRDDGPGIAAEYHERVFRMFQSLRPRDEVEGSGIGLAVVKKVVEQQGGGISLTSTPGNGSTFAFTWPLRRGAQTENAARQAPPGRTERGD